MNNELISIHDFKISRLKKYYGASKSVYRQSHVDRLLKMRGDLHYLSELFTRTRLVPCNEEFLHKKAIPHYNDAVKRMKLAYPNIKEFQRYEPITHRQSQRLAK